MVILQEDFPYVWKCSVQGVLTGSAVAILQISVWKAPLIGPIVQRDPTTARMRFVPPLTPPLWNAAAGMATTEARRECETEGCSKDAKLQCPTCIKLGIQGSYFCSQVPLSFCDFTRFRRQLLSCTGPFSLKRLLTVKLEMCALCSLNSKHPQGKR